MLDVKLERSRGKELSELLAVTWKTMMLRGKFWQERRYAKREPELAFPMDLNFHSENNEWI